MKNSFKYANIPMVQCSQVAILLHYALGTSTKQHVPEIKLHRLEENIYYSINGGIPHPHIKKSP